MTQIPITDANEGEEKIPVKRGVGSPNYDPEKAKAARRKGWEKQQETLKAQGKTIGFTSEAAKEAGRKGLEKRWGKK